MEQAIERWEPAPPSTRDSRRVARRRRPARISRTFLLVIGAVTLLTAVLAGALMVMTTMFHSATAEIGRAVDGVRAAEEATMALLLHARATDPVVIRDLEAEIKTRLSQLEHPGISAEEERAVRDARALAESYFAKSGSAPQAEIDAARTDAFRSLQEVVEINARQARTLAQRLGRWDSLANVIGGTVAALVVALVLGLLLWFRLDVVRPVLGFFAAMQRFGSGELAARAPVEGPREVQDMALRFNEMASALADQREAQYAFIAGVAHDFRNPLSALSLATHSLTGDAPLPPEPRLRATLALVRRTVSRLERMVGDLVDRSRIESGHLELRWETVDARALASAVVDLYRGTSGQHRLELEQPRESVLVVCDPMRIEQVLTNLLSNAIKYSPAGGVVRVRVSAGDDRVSFTVEDQGIGMSREELERVFEPFQRAEPLRADVPGSGLGLAVARRIVEAHRGRLRVRSEPGRGSVFEVELPRSPS